MCSIFRCFSARGRAFAAGLALLALSASASAGLRLHCHLEQGGKTWRVEAAPVADPYAVQAIDIDGKFRFKAVVVGDGTRVDYVKLYSYYQAAPQPVLLHQATYLAPAVSADTSPDSLSGLNSVYAPGLGREFQYGCALSEAKS